MLFSKSPRAAANAVWVLSLFLLLQSSPAAWAEKPRQVSFTTWDDVAISADYVAPKPQAGAAPIAILLHMYRSDRSAYAPLLGPLHDAGFAVLAIDMRGHGKSATAELAARVRARDTAVFEEMKQDVRAAYDWLAKQDGVDRSRFALVGASVGCSVALRYAAADRSVDAIVCLSPGLNYLGLDSKTDMERISGRRMWFVASTREAGASRTLAKLGASKVDVQGKGRGHGTNLFAELPDLPTEIARFLHDAVGPRSDEVCYGSIRSKVYHLSGSGWIEKIKPTNLRHYSSPEEAKSRGLRESKTRGPNDKPWEKP